MDLALLYCYNCNRKLSTNLAFFATSGQQIFLFFATKKIYSYSRSSMTSATEQPHHQPSEAAADHPPTLSLGSG